MSHFLLDEDAVQHFVRRRKEERGVKSAIQRGSDILKLAMKRGAMVRVDVLCRAEQLLILKTEKVRIELSQVMIDF